jgi:TonB-dependent receptor
VELELVEGEARGPRLRGLDAEYTQVTLDGMSLASADATQNANIPPSRSFSFEQVSLSSMEAIEINKTLSADADANAPAGTINLKTKRAFDRKGRRLSIQANANAFSDEMHLRKTYGLDDTRSRKVLPGGILEYSDVFLHNRLGVVLNVSESNVFSAIARTTHTYNYTPTAADPRPVVLTAINPLHGPRTNERFTTTFTADFKATPRLVLSLGYIYNYSFLWFWSRSPNLSTGARNTVIGSDPLLSFSTSDAGGTGRTVSYNTLGVVKLGKTQTYTPKFEYKVGDFVLDGRFAVSISANDYAPFERGVIRNATVNNLTGMNFRAERSSLKDVDWKIVQTSGPDWADLANYKNPRIQDDGRYAKTELLSGEITATTTTRRWLPIVWKTGLKSKEEIRHYSLKTDSLLWNYTGPGGGTGGSFAGYNSPYIFDYRATGASVASLSGGPLPAINYSALQNLYREHPEFFTYAPTAASYYNANIANEKKYRERIDSAFFMGTGRLGKLQLRAGLRWEDMTTVSTEFDPLAASRVVAAGYPVSAGRASTIPGLQYQYFSQPRIDRPGGYDYFFPSASAKYLLRDNLHAHLGYSHTIRRPTFNDVTGIWIVNEEALTVTAPNPNLKPETSDNFSGRLAYYFEPVGTLGLNLFYNRVKGLRTVNQYTAEEFGYGSDPDLAAYTFVSGVSSSGVRWVKGLELEYSQSLSFLPAPFKGFNVRASYTRNYADTLRVNVVPHAIAGGFSYSRRRLSLNTNVTWSDDTPWNSTGTQFRRHRAVADSGGSWRFTDKFSLFVSVRNVTNSPLLIMEQVGTNPAAVQRYEVHGTAWTFGLKVIF